MNYRLLVRVLLDYIFPRLCPRCHDRLSYMEQHICPNCAISMDRYTPAFDKAYERLYGTPLFGELYSSFVYKRGGSVQHLIYSFKYHNERSLAKFFIQHSKIEERLPSKAYDAIIPVPISSSRLRTRGYNQALLLSKELSIELGVKVLEGIILRRPHNSSQTRLRRLERSDNAHRAFYAREDMGIDLKGKSILLVDDILTTGSTLLSVCDLLERLGVAQVDVYVAAVAM